jgi:glutamate-ammonia-ligase adenylyltransferase
VAVDVVAAAVDRSAAPAAVATALERLRERDDTLDERLAGDDALREALIAVVAASRFLTRLLVAAPDVLDVVADLDTPVETTRFDLMGWKQRELLRIAARDLTGRDNLDQVGRSLAELADGVLLAAADIPGLAVIGMGKLGGRELNYASDIDLVFVGEGDARHVVDVARTCFRVDADLRPEGRSGPLSRTLASYLAYWDRWALPWEFQALLKARPVAGDAALGEQFATEAATRVWGRPFGADDLRSLRDLKARTENLVTRRGLTAGELKRGRGGIRDIEFAVQLLQLVHGRADPALRSPTTLTALDELAAAGYVAPADADALAGAYRFLRTVEHRLQLVDEQQVHRVPTNPAARDHLARVLGLRDTTASTATAQFDAQLRRHQTTVRSIHERLYFRPLLEAFTGRSAMPPSAVSDRLAAFGFTDAAQTRRALEELSSGLTRASRLMQQTLPLLLEWLSSAPDADLGLLGLRTLAAAPHRQAHLVGAFRESPEAARRLCTLLGTGRLFIDGFTRYPQLIGTLGDDAALARPVPPSVEPLQRYKRDEELRIAVRDTLGQASVEHTATELTQLAQRVLQRALDAQQPPVPMAVIAMGRFGGGELSYASDLDVLLVYDGATPEDFTAAERVALNLLQSVKGTTPANRIYLLDADLRPEGRQGAVARSLEAYRAYYARYAALWERQALLRARPVAGDLRVGEQFMSIVNDFVWHHPLTDADELEIRRMKARVESERIPPDEDPKFHLKLGPGSLSDVEWTAQLLQLRHGVPGPGTIDALAALVTAGALTEGDASVLTAAYRFCERTRNRWFLVKGAPGDALPGAGEQLSALARSLGTTGADLREQYRRVTRRSRAVVERIFYGGAVDVRSAGP